jgi:predicted enzyme related to lactoylglutathione lyase
MPRAKSRKRAGRRGKVARQMELQVASLPAEIKHVRGVKLKHVSAFTMLVSVICLSAFLAGRVDVSAARSVRSDAKEHPMFLGLRTAVYDAPDIAKAKAWYSKVLGEQPYFDQPFYVGFNVGGYELGILPVKDAAAKRARAGVAYWGVEDAQAAYKRLVDMGASPLEEIQDVGGGILIGAVRDPFGNVLGIIQNPNFKPGEAK